MSLRQALKRSREEQERSGALVERRLGGVVWFEAPKPARPPQIYREGPVNGSTELYGAAPRGTAKPDLSVEWSADPLSDRENDLVGRRATRVLVQEGAVARDAFKRPISIWILDCRRIVRPMKG